VKKDKSGYKFCVLILFSIIILIMPILSIDIFYFKNKVLWIFKNKENAYQYLQFIGVFLGVIVTVFATFIAIERQMDKEKKLQERIINQQREMDVQIKLREEFIKRILETKKSIHNLDCYNLSIKMVSENVIISEEKGEKSLLLGIEKLSTDARDFIHEAYKRYSENISDLITQLENYKNKLKHIDYDYYSILKGKHKTILDLYSKINLRISAFPNYTVPMMECLNSESKELEIELSNFAKELIRIIDELDKYYKTIDV